jgi:hypothetical protein
MSAWNGIFDHHSPLTICLLFCLRRLYCSIRRWYLLGLSLGRLLELGDGVILVRALSQLVEEYEHYIGAKRDMIASRPFGASDSSNNAAHAALAAASAQLAAGDISIPGQGQGPQLLLAPLLFLGTTAHGSAAAQATAAAAAQTTSGASHIGSTTVTSSLSSSLGRGGGGTDSADSFKPTLHKGARGQVVYAYLASGAATGLDGHLDYCELVQSLCDVLALIYAKFLHPDCSPPSVHTAIVRVDRKLRSLVLAKLSQDLATDVAQPLLKQELSGLLNHLFFDEKSNNALTAGTGGGSTAAARRFIQLDEKGALNEVDADLDDDEA